MLKIPPEVISTGRQLLVRFKTDDTINWKGFSAAFVLASRDAQPAAPDTSLRRTGSGFTSLGGTHRSKSKSVGSGGHHTKKTTHSRPKPRRYYARH